MRGMSHGLAAVVILAATAAHAQNHVERFERQLERILRDTRLRADREVAPARRALLDLGGFVSFNFFAIDDSDQRTHLLRQTDANVYARLNLDAAHELFVRVRSTYNDFNPGHDFDGRGDEWDEPTLERAYYRFDLRQAIAASEGRRIDANLTVQGGRQLIHWVNGLVLSQTLDGGVVGVEFGPIELEAIAGVTPEDTIDIDSQRPDFDDDTRRLFYGGMLRWNLSPEHQPFVYGLVQEDHNEDRVRRISGIATRFRYDSWYLGAGATGSLGQNLLYGVEVAWQGGRGLSNSFNADGTQARQTTEAIDAFAADVQLDYLFHGPSGSRLSAEFLLASGDRDRLSTSNTFGGNRIGSDDRAFNAFGLLDTGLAFSPAVSNLLMLRLGASTIPLPGHEWLGRMQVGVNVHVFAKLDRRAPIDEATHDDAYLGTEVNLFTNWRITSDLTLALRYGVFFPGEAIFVDHDERHFFYTGLTLAF